MLIVLDERLGPDYSLDMPTRTASRRSSRPSAADVKAAVDTLDSPRVRFNWGFHDATADVCAGRPARDMTSHFCRPYAAGYLAGTAAMVDDAGLPGEGIVRPESSEPAWLQHVAPVTDDVLLLALATGSDLRLAVVASRLECSGARVDVSETTRRQAQARIDGAWRLVGRDATPAQQCKACRATCRLLELATGETW